MTASKHKNLLSVLELFCNELKSYKSLLEHLDESKMIMGHELRERDELQESLVRKTGALKRTIIELTSKQYMSLFEKTYDIWSEAFNPPPYLPRQKSALNFCINATNEAIGKLESDIEMGIRDNQGNVIEKPPELSKKPAEVIGELPIQLFDKMQFHPKVVEASRSCFVAGNYREAILNAFIRLIDYIKERTGLDLDGDDLMNKVFSFNYDKDLRKITKYPIIRINELKNSNDRNEQQGFMFLCKGAAGGIRNPKAHKLITQSNPLHTLEYLAFASLLMRTVEEGAVAKTSLPRTKWDWGRFLADTKSKCELGIVRLAVNLYEFTRSNSDFISWGTGNQDGSFTFRKLGLGGMISIFSMYSCGWIYINFGSLKNKNVPGNIMDSFRYNLNTIQNINIPKESVTNGKFARIYEKPLTNSKNLKLFQDAIISLCQQIE